MKVRIDWDKVKTKAARFTSKIGPATRVLERAAGLAVQMQHVTPLGAVSIAAAGANGLHDWLKDRTTGYGTELGPWVASADLVPAMVAAGAAVAKQEQHEGGASITMRLAGAEFVVGVSGLMQQCPKGPEFEAWLRQAIDAALPSAVEVVDRKDQYPAARLVRLAGYQTEAGREIAEQTAPMLEHGPRCILLQGRPGAGKTSMAHEVAQRLKLGRVVVLANTRLGSSMDESTTAPTATRGSLDGLAMLSPGVIVVDDVDKVRLSLHALEAIRSMSRLVILTANNGDCEDVIDGATGRPGRIDEIITVNGQRSDRAPPFDRLDAAMWAEVRDWPVAYQNEVAARLRHRPATAEALGLAELRQRLRRKTRSGEVLR